MALRVLRGTAGKSSDGGLLNVAHVLLPGILRRKRRVGWRGLFVACIIVCTRSANL
ncbi:hypothetical protein MHPYR_280030 [uncultured Mycobacterium sp.]|uniref:Uncharacterized protein n=1 Tax=uncultured Mycobacterium sp. TaxID=171292 RepID=A0A1Y5PAZ0_9MYCO|nr:hypothetical protein MHPYR_280030 [uncultured Mycobacterium sp.]